MPPIPLLIRTLAWLAFASATVSAAAAEGRIYRWVDADGVAHYGDAPPVRGRPLTLKGSAASADARRDEPAPVDAAACAAKREQLDRYRRAEQISETNALGETRTYSSDEKQRLLVNTEVQVRAACGDR